MDKLGPQIVIANNVACKSLDWLETKFPVIHAPTEQVVSAAKNKVSEIQDVVSIAANGTVDCVQHTVTWLMGRMEQVYVHADQPLVQRAISVAGVGLDSALIMSETLMDCVLPPSEEDKAEAHLLEGFEVAALRRSYHTRLISLAARLCRRTYHIVGSKIQSVQMMENLSRSPGLVQDLQTCWLTLATNIQELPQYLQHQLVSLFFFFSQIYNLSCPPAQHQQSNQERACLNGTSTHKDVVLVHPQATPSRRGRRQTKMSPFEIGCNVKGCGRP
uniref:perilipin-2-like isoform X2 n=1 Tax=Semicossyphus pulcher TaxID=241346 RepID=UPI0037E8D3AE